MSPNIDGLQNRLSKEVRHEESNLYDFYYMKSPKEANGYSQLLRNGEGMESDHKITQGGERNGSD